MLPDQPISVPSDAVEASAALRDLLNAREAGKYTTGVGLKQTGGEFTPQIALFVYVPQKRPSEEVLEGELIPAEFNGYPTDVVEVQPVHIDDTARYDPLCGGIEISRERLIQDGIFAPPTGTLGAVATSRVHGGEARLLTCAHVVQQSGINVYQPGLVSISPFGDVVGTVDTVRREFNPMFLDCATIALNGSRGAKPLVEGIGAVQGALVDLPPLGEVVKKRGKRTLLTFGFVVRLSSSGFVPAIDQIEISGAVPFVTLFAGAGDSGSVVLNANNQAIGLLFAIPREDLGAGLGSGGLAMPIFNVQEALQVDIAR
ncbi:hypothetical protein ACFY93_10795 [Streptomyces sp. NPDC008313]|uniref:hypothetical protein n=1 Tax=Streptomyces sp. NPDC008313 TaxID=3364826 RepID=UPI0036E23D68